MFEEEIQMNQTFMFLGLNPNGMVNWHPVTEPFGIQTGRSRYI